MIRRLFIFSVFATIILTQFSCKKDAFTLNEDGVVIDLEPHWVRSLHKAGTFYSNSIIREHLIHNGNPIVPTTDGEDNFYINNIDINTGEDIWRWNDVFDGYTGLIDIRYAYISDNLMWYQKGSRSYTIDLSNGATVRKERFDVSFDSRVTGIGDKVFILGRTDLEEDRYAQYGYDADMITGEKNLSVIPELSLDYITNDGLIGGIANYSVLIENGDTLLAVVYVEPLENWYIDSYLGLYNFSKKEWVYDRVSLVVPTQGNGISGFPIIHEGKVYMSLGNEIICHNLYTGERIWGKAFPLDFLFSGFIVEDGRVIGNCENGVLYCLDAETGTQLWTGEGSGTSSRLRYLNGVVYFSGGGPSKIFAIEAATGETLWRLEASLIEEGASRFKSDFYVIPEKKKVIVCTFKNAYCFDAIR